MRLGSHFEGRQLACEITRLQSFPVVWLKVQLNFLSAALMTFLLSLSLFHL
jgi:hypothetical protein